MVVVGGCVGECSCDCVMCERLERGVCEMCEVCEVVVFASSHVLERIQQITSIGHIVISQA